MTPALTPVEASLWELFLARENLAEALRRVERNAGAAGIDGMSTKGAAAVVGRPLATGLLAATPTTAAYVASERAGQRVMESISTYVEQRLKLEVNREKSVVDRATKRPLLGFGFLRRDGEVKVRVDRKAR